MVALGQLKRLSGSVVLGCLVILLASCVAAPTIPSSPLPATRSFGHPVSYGEGKHPGLDWELNYGTLIVAASHGRVGGTRAGYFEGGKKCRFNWATTQTIKGVSEPDNFCGYNMVIIHDRHFSTFYHHLKTFFVNFGDVVERGQPIGLSGSDEFGNWPHLHFSVFQNGTNPIFHSTNIDPDTLWLGGKSQCFDPDKDYSGVTQDKLTHPVACGEYARRFLEKIS